MYVCFTFTTEGWWSIFWVVMAEYFRRNGFGVAHNPAAVAGRQPLAPRGMLGMLAIQQRARRPLTELNFAKS